MSHQLFISKVMAERKAKYRVGHHDHIKEWKDLARKFNGDPVRMVAEYERLEAIKEALAMAEIERSR